jgi:flagellar motor component MotA
MKLFELFWIGGIGFMTVLSIFGILMFFYSVKGFIAVFMKKDYSGHGLNYILLFGSLAVTFGVLGQAIGLFQAFSAIQEAGDISPSLVAGGLQASMITTLYGAIIFIISLPVWVVLREKLKKSNQE